ERNTLAQCFLQPTGPMRLPRRFGLGATPVAYGAATERSFSGRASRPKSAWTRLYHASSSNAPQLTHSSSVIDALQSRNGFASGPTGCRSCQVPVSTMSRMASATSEGGVGLASEALNRLENREAWGYNDSPAGASMRRAIAVSIIPGWTIATRMLKGFTSWASASLSASRANLEAA